MKGQTKFEEDTNLDFELLGFLFWLKYVYKKKVFSIMDIEWVACSSPEEIKKIIQKLFGHGYISKAERPKEWAGDVLDGRKYGKKRNFYRWQDVKFWEILETTAKEQCEYEEKRQIAMAKYLQKYPSL
jgi:hypothetical protein